VYNRFIAAPFTIKSKKQHKCPEIDEWISKWWYVCIREYYSLIKRSEVLTHVAHVRIWMNLNKHYA
jgi:hypothetical protein